MPGRKLFVNATPNTISTTIVIRSGENPANSAGKHSFTLKPGESSWVNYGTSSDIYLNGISLIVMGNGSVIGQQDFVLTRGSLLDNTINMRNVIEFSGGPEVHVSSREA